MLVRESPTCFRGLPWSWLGSRNTSWAVCTSCHLAETAGAALGDSGGSRWGMRWWEGLQDEGTREAEFPSRSPTPESPSWRTAWPHACTLLQWLKKRDVKWGWGWCSRVKPSLLSQLKAQRTNHGKSAGGEHWLIVSVWSLLSSLIALTKQRL